MGDLNSVLDGSEVSDPKKLSHSRCTDFAEWVFDQGLIDIGFEGPIMTWEQGNQDNTFKITQLDRALGKGEWVMRIQNALVRYLPMMHSDHSPLLLNTTGNHEVRRHIPFMFQAAWLSSKDMDNVVKKAWQSNFTLLENIDNLKPKLETWNKEVFGNIRHKKDK